MSTITLTKQWDIKHPDPQLQVELSDALHVHPIIAQLLVNRQVDTVDQARSFLNGSIKDLHDPFLFKDMDVAVERINKARDNKEKVLVFGDYDVDGVTSSAVLYFTFKQLGIDVTNYIPHRFNEGYGLNHEIGDFAKDNDIKLLIAVDCGITAHSEVERINSLGIDVIILDHHVPAHEKDLPEALAIVNPKRKDCPYPFEQLASVGLSCKLAQALLGRFPEEYLDLLAIGTIADIVPLRDENRIFVKEGLPKIPETKNAGLQALLEVAKIKGKKMKPFFIGFVIGPRLNAGGRMDSAQKSLDLLLAPEKSQAIAFAQALESLNSQRQRMQNDIIQQALGRVERDINFKDDKVIVVGEQGWHKGVLGIVAARIAETYYRPAIVISFDGEMGTASARSVPGFHLYDALDHCSEHLEAFGGHKGAAGLTIRKDNLDSFRKSINAYAGDVFLKKPLTPTLEIDSEVPLSSLNLKLIDIIDSLQPYGEGNRIPVFCSCGVTISSRPAVLGKETLKFWVTDGKATLSAVGFRMAKYKDMIAFGDKVDLAYELTIDDWNKAPQVQLRLKDIKHSSG